MFNDDSKRKVSHSDEIILYLTSLLVNIFLFGLVTKIAINTMLAFVGVYMQILARVESVKFFDNEMLLDFVHNKLSVGTDVAPLALDGKPQKLQVIIDRYSIEVFVGDGEIIMAVPIRFSEEDANGEDPDVYCYGI